MAVDSLSCSPSYSCPCSADSPISCAPNGLPVDKNILQPRPLSRLSRLLRRLRLLRLLLLLLRLLWLWLRRPCCPCWSLGWQRAANRRGWGASAVLAWVVVARAVRQDSLRVAVAAAFALLVWHAAAAALLAGVVAAVADAAAAPLTPVIVSVIVIGLGHDVQRPC